jgi:membrane protein YqaA with SNARE-associated domain
LHKRVVILVADGARADLTKQLLGDGHLPNIQRHVVERGCYRTALSVLPSTTGPAHIPFVCGLHPGTANIPGYRWLDRELHDRRRRSIYRHRSLNSPRGLLVGRDMDPERCTSLYQYFDKPSSVLELIDFCPDQRLYKITARRLFRIIQAHRHDDWSRVDETVERLVVRRIKAGSECVIGSCFGIDEYSHLYGPLDSRTIEAYKTVDCTIGAVADALKTCGAYDDTIIAVVSDHGLTATDTHIPLVDIVKQHGFNPYHYPHAYRRERDCAVLESGNALAALYFKRNARWGPHWRWDELVADGRIKSLLDTLLATPGISLLGARANESGIIWASQNGALRAGRHGDLIHVSIEGQNPLGTHPEGAFTTQELFERTFNDTYPDAVNQLFMLLTSARSGDIVVNAEPGFDLRLQHEFPEHHASHGSLHREHMQVPLMISVPLSVDKVSNCDIVPTVLDLCGKTPRKPLDGVSRAINPPSVETCDALPGHSSLIPAIVTAVIVVAGLVLTAAFKEDILAYGQYLMRTHSAVWVDWILLIISAVSSTPLALPIWAYTIVGIALGYHVVRLAAVMAIGSATGSLVTFMLGKYYGNSAWVRRRFPNLHKNSWTHGKSRTYVTLLLFLGTASPIPCDILYAASGAKLYPTSLFWVNMVAARFVRYVVMGYAFIYFRDVVERYIW